MSDGDEGYAHVLGRLIQFAFNVHRHRAGTLVQKSEHRFVIEKTTQSHALFLTATQHFAPITLIRKKGNFKIIIV